jgi:hypothetical protein
MACRVLGTRRHFGDGPGTGSRSRSVTGSEECYAREFSADMISKSSLPVEPKVLLDGLAMVESPRWHDGRLWFAHWGTGEIRAVDLDGKSEVMGHGPEGLGDDRLAA